MKLHNVWAETCMLKSFLETKNVNSFQNTPDNLDVHASVTAGVDLGVLSLSLTGIVDIEKDDIVRLPSYQLH